MNLNDRVLGFKRAPSGHNPAAVSRTGAQLSRKRLTVSRIGPQQGSGWLESEPPRLSIIQDLT